MSTGYDCTAEDRVPFDPEKYLDDLYVPDVQAIDQTAEELDARAGFCDPPLGKHEFVVTGLLVKKDATSPFTAISKDQYVDGQRVLLQTNSCAVKLAMVKNRNAQTLLTLWLPPSDPKHLRAYYEGKKTPESKGQGGFMAGIFFKFLSSIGYNYKPGERLPKEALAIKNWVGRRLVAEIVKGQDTYNQQTGETLAGRPQIGPYKMWPVTAATGVTNGASGGGVSAPGAVQRPAPAAEVAASAKTRGLENI